MPETRIAAHQIRPMHIIRAFDRWLRVYSTTTEIGGGIAETRLRCVEFNAGKNRPVEIHVPPDWLFTLGIADEILGIKDE